MDDGSCAHSVSPFMMRIVTISQNTLSIWNQKYITILYGTKSVSLISNKYSLCQILTVLPASSIDCKHGFSNLNHIKRDDRNRVDGDHLVWLMHVFSFDMDQIDFEKRRLPLLIPSWKAKKKEDWMVELIWTWSHKLRVVVFKVMFLVFKYL